MAKNSVRTKPISVQIAEPQQRQAVAAIEAMSRAYEPIAARLLKIAEPIFKLAVLAAQLGKGVPEYTEAYFKGLCKHAEAKYKEAHGVENLKESLPCWPVFKSEINRAIGAGLSPKDFESYSALKKAREEHDRAEEQAEVDRMTAGRESAAMRDGVRAGGGGTEGLGSAATSARVTPKLSATLTVLQGAIGGMDEDTQDKFAEELAELVSKYAPKMQGKGEQRAARRTRAAKPEQEAPAAEPAPAGSVAA